MRFCHFKSLLFNLHEGWCKVLDMLGQRTFFNNLDWNSSIFSKVIDFISDWFFINLHVNNILIFVFNSILNSYKELSNDFNILSEWLKIKFSVEQIELFKRMIEGLLWVRCNCDCSDVVLWISNMFPFIKVSSCEFLLEVQWFIVKSSWML